MEPKSPLRVPALILFLAALLAWAPLRTAAQAKKPGALDIRVTVTVLDPHGRPVKGAGVVLRQASVDHGKLGKNPFDVEMHTGRQGTITVQGFQPGIVLVQVIAKDYNTYGQAFIMRHANETVHVKLHPPKGQITIYH
jgi:hypothetical protein